MSYVAVGIGVAGAAASAYGAHKASNAAKDAAKIQSASADKAQGFNQQVYDDQRRNMSPYMNAGNESLARLMAQHWGTPYQPPPGAPGASGPPPMWTTPDGKQHVPGQVPGAMASGQALGGMQTQGGPRMNPNGPMPGPGGPPQAQPRTPGGGPNTLAAMQQQAQGQGAGMVEMQAPDGSIRPVPAAQVALLEQRGARRVG